MRVLQLHAQYRDVGGEDAVVQGERQLLEDAGHEVAVFARPNGRGGARAAAQLAAYPWNPIADRAVMAMVKDFRPQVVHVHNTWFALSPSVFRRLRRAGVPIVATLHNYRLVCANAQLMRDEAPCDLCTKTSPWQGVRYRCYHDSLGASFASVVGIEAHRILSTWRRFVDHFFVLTEFSRDHLRAAGLPPDRVSVRSNFAPDPGRRAHSPSSSPNLIYVGRLSREKGVHVLLDAWKRAETAEMQLLIAGDGPERGNLEAAANHTVRFLGRIGRGEVDELLLGARALLCPSLSFEGQPRGVLEAFAAGLPVLGSSAGGLGETIAPLGCRWAAPPGDIEAWRDAIEDLSDDQHIRQGAQVAREAYEARYTTTLALESLEGTYARVSNDVHRAGASR